MGHAPLEVETMQLLRPVLLLEAGAMRPLHSTNHAPPSCFGSDAARLSESPVFLPIKNRVKGLHVREIQTSWWRTIRPHTERTRERECSSPRSRGGRRSLPVLHHL